MYKIDEIKMLRLGQRDENLAREIQMDVSDWLELYPGASIQILFRRPGESTITPMVSTLVDGVLTWQIHDFEVGKTGVGNAEIRAVDTAGLRRKSRIIPCSIEETLLGADETVLYTQDQVDDTLAHISEAAQAAQAAKASEEAAALSAQEAGESAVSAGTAADVAVSAKDAAQAAQTAAETAQHQAEAAQSGVHADAVAAEQAKVAAQAAQASAQGAASQASADRTAAETARADASAAATHAEEVVEGIDQAGADQVAAVNAAGQAQVTAVNTAGTTQVGNVNTAGTTQINAVQAKGTQVINSIPEDYSTLSSDVTGLKSAVSELESLDNAPAIIATASGAIASFDDGADDRPMKNLVAHIEPVQDLHGYDHPWPAGGGKNLFDKNAVSSGSYNPTNGASNNYGIHSDYIKVTPGQSISVNKVKTMSVAEGEQTFLSSWTYWDSNKQFVSGVWNSAKTVTVPDNASYLIVSTSRSIGNSSGQFTQSTVDEFLADYIIADGATIPTFAPYSNICPISGWTGAKVMRLGRNLWDGLYSVQNAYLFSTGNLTNGNNEDITSYIRVEPGQAYCFGPTCGVSSAFCWYDANKIYISGQSYASRTLITTTAPSNAYYLRATVYKPNASAFYVYLKADVGKEYEEPNCQTYDITFPTEAGTVYGGTLDVVSGVLTVDRAMVVDMGAMNWTYQQANLRFWSDGVNNLIKKPSEWGNALVCSAYRSIIWSSTEDKFITLANNGRLFVKDTAYTDAATFKAAMDGAQLVYELATPITYQLTPQEVKTLLGQNNVWADTGDSDVTYQADTKLYIEQLTKPTEDDTKANTAITSGKFFMIGNRLFLATAAIASGATIIPGTNCTELSLADALNSFNA